MGTTGMTAVVSASEIASSVRVDGAEVGVSALSRPLGAAAAELGDLETLVRLEDTIRRNRPVDGTGYTPLHYAAQQGHDRCVKFLLERCKLDPDARSACEPSGARSVHLSLPFISACGATPLHRAAFAGQLGCVWARGAGALSPTRTQVCAAAASRRCPS